MSAAAISPNLFEAARLGDPQAIAELLVTAQPDIRRCARATCRSSADAEDATQEALLLSRPKRICRSTWPRRSRSCRRIIAMSR